MNSTFDRVLRIIEEWRPKKDYRSEAGYRDDLMVFVRKELKRGSIWGPPERHRIRKESGRHLVDIGIELKRNLGSQSGLDRLIGQIRRFMRSYDYIIVVLCGEVDEGILDDLRVEFKEYSARGVVWGRSETVVEVVGKGKQKEKKGPKGWVDLFEQV